ncbi:MAG: M1 family metallopeptidase [Pseudomonadota bacterium]|nr:M1 family metallopeptidase [Pseudomonadota bacterium]
MILLRNLALGAVALITASCGVGETHNSAVEASGGTQSAPILTTADARDPHSYARPLEARVNNVALDLALDFQAKRVGGTATLDIDRKPDAKEIVLDTDNLEIQSVTDAAGQPLDYKLGTDDPKMGAPLTIALGPDTKKIVIRYRSGADAEALQWLVPEQTAGKKHPYLFSQGQPTLNRTWIPTQDSPGIRQTWSATVTAPEPLNVVMSGERLTPNGEPAGEGRRAFRFRMDKPVAPYLIAIAAGDIAFRALGPRTGVWTEPAMLDRAAAELADTEKMVEAAEKLYGPYRWGRYDMLVLPPSFPYGGMENPTLTFLTPTFIAGDKSLVSLVAHELAHSWSGNLVTNATWADSWLNEGFTNYFENRIMEAIYGTRRAQQEAALSFDDMMETLDEEGMSDPTTRLNLPPAEATPEGGATGIVYDKGAIFLRTIESIVGREAWDAYLRSYFDRYAFEPMTSARFLADLREHLVKGDSALEKKLMLDEWVYQPGLPSNVARPAPSAFAEVDRAIAGFKVGGAVPTGFAGWSTAEKLRFLNGLPRKLPTRRLGELDRQLRLNGAGNNEVLFAWLELAVANRYDAAVPALERFLTTQGRRKFVAPLIEALAKDQQWGRPIAARIYPRARPLYHPITTRGLDELGLPAG